MPPKREYKKKLYSRTVNHQRSVAGLRRCYGPECTRYANEDLLSTPGHNQVKQILYSKKFSTADTEFGTRNESVAITIFQNVYNKNVRPAGLHIDREFGFLGASPDGVIEDENEIIEIKCFPSLLRTETDIESAARSKIGFPLKYADKNLEMNKKHDYYFQLSNQGSLVTQIHNVLAKIQRGKEPFTPEAINFLGKIQKRYTKAEQYSNVFITKQLTTDNEIMEEFQKRQLSKEYLQCEHKCTQCFRHFKYGKMLKHHLKQYHDTNKLHKCRYCDVRFDRPLTLYHHIQTHKVVYQCKMCPLATNHKSVMKSHCDYHKGVKYPCTKCDAVFKSHPVLAAHMNRAHQPDHICPCCAKMFYTANGLFQHRVKKHQNDLNTVGPPSAKCEQCDVQFISDEVYLEHQSNSHKKLIPRIVKLGKKRKISTLNRRKPRFRCRMCKAVESSIGGLMWHFKSEHPNEQVEIRDMALRAPHQYLCHECGKDFKDITNFTDHKNTHTGVRPYACTECPKSFYYRRHLNNHLPLHSPPTKLCPHCGKAFRSNSNLCNHLRQHTGNRRHACEICGKTFLHKSALTEHVRSVHLHIRRTRKPKQRVLD